MEKIDSKMYYIHLREEYGTQIVSQEKKIAYVSTIVENLEKIFKMEQAACASIEELLPKVEHLTSLYGPTMAVLQEKVKEKSFYENVVLEWKKELVREKNKLTLMNEQLISIDEKASLLESSDSESN